MQRQRVRLFMLFEALAFSIAALIHFSILWEGYGHQRAGIAESVIAGVLWLGLLATWLWPGAARMIGLIAQGFAGLGTVVGVFMIIVGVGPRTLPDVIYHLGILIVLAFGFLAARQMGQEKMGHSPIDI